MTQLKWQDVPTKTVSKSPSSSVNPWFALTLGLVGIIVGYIIQNILH